MNARLMRSRSDFMVGGVCGGMGKFVGIDPSLVRLFFVLLTLGNGIGAVAYLILWIVLPREDMVEEGGTPGSREEFANRARQVGQEMGEVVRNPDGRSLRYLGIALIIGGIYFFIQNLHLPWLKWLNSDVLWPLILVIAGAALLVRALRGK
jgi:phage shock protein C